jgi:hypothetical protein
VNFFRRNLYEHKRPEQKSNKPEHKRPEQILRIGSCFQICQSIPNVTNNFDWSPQKASKTVFFGGFVSFGKWLAGSKNLSKKVELVLSGKDC